MIENIHQPPILTINREGGILSQKRNQGEYSLRPQRLCGERLIPVALLAAAPGDRNSSHLTLATRHSPLFLDYRISEVQFGQRVAASGICVAQ
jgi:hypothetical protein